MNPSPATTCPPCGQKPRRKVDYGDFSEHEVRCLVAEYCMSVTLGFTGWGVDFKTWVELRGIAKHDGMFRLIRLPNDRDASARVTPLETTGSPPSHPPHCSASEIFELANEVESHEVDWVIEKRDSCLYVSIGKTCYSVSSTLQKSTGSRSPALIDALTKIHEHQVRSLCRCGTTLT